MEKVGDNMLKLPLWLKSRFGTYKEFVGFLLGQTLSVEGLGEKNIPGRGVVTVKGGAGDFEGKVKKKVEPQGKEWA